MKNKKSIKNSGHKLYAGYIFTMSQGLKKDSKSGTESPIYSYL